MALKEQDELITIRRPRRVAIGEFFCGWGSGFINIAVTFPIYKIMFRQMLHGVDTQYAFNQLRKEGLRYLYRGCLPPWIQKTVSMSIMFGTYHEYGEFIHKNFPSMPEPVPLTVAALLAGSTEAILTPFERVQSLLQDQKYHNRFKNTFHAFRELRIYGVKEYYRGLTPILMRNGPSNVMFFGLKSTVKNVVPPSESWVGNLVEHFISGALIGAFISTIFYPINVIKIKMQSSCGTKYISFSEACRLTYLERDRSLRKMFYGVHMNYTRAFLSWGIINASYELLKKALLEENR